MERVKSLMKKSSVNGKILTFMGMKSKSRLHDNLTFSFSFFPPQKKVYTAGESNVQFSFLLF